MQSLTRIGNRNRHLLFAGLTLIAVAAAGYKIARRDPAPTFVPPAIKALLSHGHQASAGQPLRLEPQFVSSQPGQAVHAPSVVELKDGSLRAVWFSGSREGAGDVSVQTAVMNAATGQWGSESTLFDRQQLQRGLLRYVKKIGNPVIARVPDGSLHLWMVNVSLGGWAGSAISWARSVDDGMTWSAPRRLVTSPFLNISTLVKGAPLAMADGSVGLPVYHEFITKFAEVLHISAQGQVTDKTRIPGSHSSLQPVVLVASPVKADVYMRASQGGRVVTSATNDAGQTWAPARSVNLPNPDSAMAGLVASSGDKWLALNPTAAGRQSMALLKATSVGSFETAKTLFVEGSAAASQAGNSLSITDHSALLGRELKAQGASDADIQAYIGSAARQLCGSSTCAKEFSYPFLLQTRDGGIHLVYTWHRSRIKHVRIDHAALD